MLKMWVGHWLDTARIVCTRGELLLVPGTWHLVYISSSRSRQLVEARSNKLLEISVAKRFVTTGLVHTLAGDWSKYGDDVTTILDLPWIS